MLSGWDVAVRGASEGGGRRDLVGRPSNDSDGTGRNEALRIILHTHRFLCSAQLLQTFMLPFSLGCMLLICHSLIHS